MQKPLQVLHLEDDPNDSELVREALAAGDMICDILRVDNRVDFTGMLQQAKFDVILADYALPAFDGISAMAIAREKCPDVPFIFVSGTLGEEVAIETLKSGATDYVLKSRLSRLVPAMHRALAEASQRAELKRAEHAMLQSEYKYRHLFECLADAAFLVDVETGRVLDANQQAETLLQRTRAEIIGAKRSEWFRALPRQSPPPEHSQEQAVSPAAECEAIRKDESKVPVLVETTLVTLYGKLLQLQLVQDITERKRVEEDLRKLSGSLLQAQDDERRRIARELHDTTSQNLAALGMSLSLLRQTLQPTGGKVDDLLNDCERLAEQSTQQIRTVSYLLHPPILDVVGLVGALREYIEGFSGRSRIEVQFQSPENFGRLPRDVETALFRVVQESLGNILRHSGSPTATVRLQLWGSDILLEVADHGRGIPAERLQAFNSGSGDMGVGIAGMRERLHQLGGRLQIESGDGGTVVRALVPNKFEL